MENSNWWNVVSAAIFCYKDRKISQGWSLTYKRLLKVGRDDGNRTHSLR